MKHSLCSVSLWRGFSSFEIQFTRWLCDHRSLRGYIFIKYSFVDYLNFCLFQLKQYYLAAFYIIGRVELPLSLLIMWQKSLQTDNGVGQSFYPFVSTVSTVCLYFQVTEASTRECSWSPSQMTWLPTLMALLPVFLVLLSSTIGREYLSVILATGFSWSPICDSSPAYFILLFSYSWLCPLDIEHKFCGGFKSV